MIRADEFARFQQLDKECHQLMVDFYREVVVGRVVRLPDQLPITVKFLEYAEKYDFAMTRFGVVKLLSDDCLTFDKSQLCLALDAKLREEFEYEKTLFMRGSKHVTKPR